jgi:UPF0271 protein
MLVLVGLSGSTSIVEAERLGLTTASEAFGDRTYQPDGSLTPRRNANAMIEDADTAAAQVLSMVRDRSVTAVTGKRIDIKADTVCIHGDSAGAVTIAKAVRSALDSNGIAVVPFTSKSK